MRVRNVLSLSLLLMLGCSSPADTSSNEGSAGSASGSTRGYGELVVAIEGFANDDGRALIALFLDSDGFPSDQKRAHISVEREITDGRVELVFERVPAGPFAIAVFHDEDGDYELDTNFLGIPSERWGVSRDAGGFLGPPSFDSAKLELEPGETMTITIPLG